MKSNREKLLPILHNPKDNLMDANEVIKSLILVILDLDERLEKIESGK